MTMVRYSVLAVLGDHGTGELTDGHTTEDTNTLLLEEKFPTTVKATPGDQRYILPSPLSHNFWPNEV